MNLSLVMAEFKNTYTFPSFNKYSNNCFVLKIVDHLSLQTDKNKTRMNINDTFYFF